MVSFCRGRGFQHDPNAASCPNCGARQPVAPAALPAKPQPMAVAAAPATKFRPVPEPDSKSIEVAFAVLKTLN